MKMRALLTIILLTTYASVSAQIIIPDQIHSGSTEPVEYATNGMEQTFTCGISGHLNAVHLTLKYHSDSCFSSDTVGVALGIKDMLNNYVMGYSDTIYLPNTNTFNAYLFKFDLPNLFFAGNSYSFRVARISDSCPITNSADILVYTDSLGSYDRGQFQHQVAGLIQGPYADVYFTTSMSPLSGALVEDVCDQFVSPSGLYTWNQSGTYTDTIPSALGYDSLIVVNLTINNSNTGTDVRSACGSYTWIDGNTYTSSNSTATVLLTNQSGCDSLVTLNLTIDNLNNSVTDNGSTLLANEAFASYQWIDCSTDQPIANESSQMFTVTQSGSYAVIITQGACTDTSACYNVTITDATEYLNDVQFTVHPNPATESVTISDMPVASVLRIIDVTGKVVYSSMIQERTTINIAELDNGIYFIQAPTGQGLVSQRLVVNH